MDDVPSEPAWRASKGVRYEGKTYRAVVEGGELILYRRPGLARPEELRWPLQDLGNPVFQDHSLAYKDYAFKPVHERGALEFQVGRGHVRLAGPPDELRDAYDLIREAAQRDPTGKTRTN